MKTLIGVVLGLLLFGCASTTPEGTALSDGSVSYTVTCEHDWSACYGAAKKICGGNNFEELDRMADSAVMTAGQLENSSIKDGGGRDNQVYTELPRNETFRRVLTIRCK